MKNGVKLEAPYTEHLYQLASPLKRHERQLLMIEPEMRSQFRCSGCGECCQRPWAISISQNYYEKWYDHFENHPSGRFRGALQKYPQPSREKYANIARKTGTHECIFLDDDRHCFIQKEYGEEALSQVCRTYPRYEQWQGLFIGRFLSTGCPDVGELWPQFPDLYAFPIQVSEAQWQAWRLHPHPMDPLVGVVWTGFTLDVATPELTAQQNMRRLGHYLKTLSRHNLQHFSIDHLRTWYIDMGSQGPAPEDPSKQPQAFQGLLHYAQSLPLLHRFLEEIRHGLVAPPQLSAAERHDLNTFMHDYLRYRLVTVRIDPNRPDMGFFHSYFELGVQILLLQWLALYYRYRDQSELNIHHLIRAYTQIGYRLEHNLQLDKPMFTPRDTPTLLEALDTLMQLDPGKSPHHV